MQASFDDKQAQAKNPQQLAEQDQKRREENAVKSERGEPQQGGSAGRAQVADADPSKHDPTTGGPGAMGNKPVQDPTI